MITKLLPNQTYALAENVRGGNAKTACLFSFAKSEDAFTFRFTVCDGDLYSPYACDNDPIYNGDAVEVFLSPDGNPGRYYELEVSPFGVRFFALVENALDGVPTFRAHTVPPQFRTEARRRKDGYNVEITLPFDALQDLNRSACTVNAFRLDYDAAGKLKELQALNPTLRGVFHLPQFFIKL